MGTIIDASKKEILSSLKSGDKVRLTSNEIAIFSKLNRSKFIGEVDGKIYDIPINMFVRVVTNEVIPLKEYECMQINEYFYANEDNKAVLYVFQKHIGYNIVAKNPINDKTEYIPVGNFYKRLKLIRK